MLGRFSSTILASAIACAFTTVSHAATVGTFNFDNDQAFTTVTPFTDTSNGISATFSSPDDPAAFVIAPTSFVTLTGNVLGSSATGDTQLDVTFNQTITDASLLFETSDFGTAEPFDLQAYNGSALVGSATATGSVPNGGLFPEGTIAFNGAGFNELILSAPLSSTFAIDDLSATAAPEPAALGLAFLGLLAILGASIRRRFRLSTGSIARFTSTAAVCASYAAIAGAATVPALLPLPATSASISPSNGDGNPYGTVFVPKTVPADGVLVPGAVLVSNFNNSLNLQGTGTSIVQIDKYGNQTLFFNNQQPVTGLTAALGIFSDGLVLAGFEPSIDGTPATVRPGGVEIINRKGQLFATLGSSAYIDGPWGMAIHENGQGLASVFISNVLNGTVARLDVFENGNSLSVLKETTIASGLSHRLDPAAFTLGPAGLAYDAAHDVLYVANSADNNIYSIAGAAAATGPTALHIVYSDLTHLHGPLDLVLAPTGHLLVANSDGSNIDPNQPSELVEFTTSGEFVAQYSVDPNNGGAFGLALNYPGFSTFTIAAVDDNQNVVKVWTETVN